MDSITGLISFGIDSKRMQLPQVEFVDIVNLKGVETNCVSEYMQNAVDAPSIRLEGKAAEEIADLWRRLPKDLNMRCHIPPFGLRFYCNGELYLRASLCWQCDNIFGDIKGEKFSSTFNPKHRTAKKLLSLCKQMFESND